jgi:hypothetical protein
MRGESKKMKWSGTTKKEKKEIHRYERETVRKKKLLQSFRY